MLRHFGLALTALALLLPAHRAAAQSADGGLPVTDALVIAKCGSCHARDREGVMEHISWSRSTPEGWQAVLKEMILMHNLSVTPDEARAIVKYLSDHLGLAAEESRPILFDPERIVREETYIPGDRMRAACARCHTFARVLSWRRSQGEWRWFIDSHASRYKVRPDDAAEAAAYLMKAAPLHTPQWDARTPANNGASLAGLWLVTASIPGKGWFYGELTVQPAGTDEYTTTAHLISIHDGSAFTRRGKAAVYAGIAWRGRSSGIVTAGQADRPSPDDPSSDAREVIGFAADAQSGEGRWFWGQYQEFGINVKLRRPPVDDKVPVLFLSDHNALRIGSTANRIRIVGANLPVKLSPSDLSVGSGIIVRDIVSATPTEIIAQMDVDSRAIPGRYDLTLRGASAPLAGAVALYDRIDYMKITPESAMASFGDAKHPRGFLQFEAIAWQRGPDGRSHTDDDIELGPVEANWALQVFHAADGESSDYVGTMSPDGLLTPSVKNPGVNFDTWVIATAKNELNPAGEPLVGKAYVVVTIPTYAFNGRQWVRDLDRWIDDGPAGR